MPTHIAGSAVSFDWPHLYGSNKDDDNKGKALDREKEQKPKNFICKKYPAKNR